MKAKKSEPLAVAEVQEMRREFDTEQRRRKTAGERRIESAKESNEIYRAEEQLDPSRTARLIVRLAFQLRDGYELSFNARSYLHKALIGAALNPRKAPAAFGLVRKKQRPKEPESEQKHAEVVIDLLKQGQPSENHSVKPVLAQSVAKTHCLSPEQVQQIWRASAPRQPKAGRKAGNGLRPLIARHLAKTKSAT